jgi:hypothetical protein
MQNQPFSNYSPVWPIRLLLFSPLPTYYPIPSSSHQNHHQNHSPTYQLKRPSPSQWIHSFHENYDKDLLRAFNLEVTRLLSPSANPGSLTPPISSTLHMLSSRLTPSTSFLIWTLSQASQSTSRTSLRFLAQTKVPFSIFFHL